MKAWRFHVHTVDWFETTAHTRLSLRRSWKGVFMVVHLSFEDKVTGGKSDRLNHLLHKMFLLIVFDQKAGSGLPKIFRARRLAVWRPLETK